MSEKWADTEEIINVPVWPCDRPGHQQEAAVRPRRARRERNPDLDEAPLTKPPAVAAPSKSDFEAPGLTPGALGAEQCEKAYELKVTQRFAAQRLQEAERRTRATAGERAAKRIKLQFSDRPINPESSNKCKSRELQQCKPQRRHCSGVMLQVLAMSLQGSVAQDTAQDAVMCGVWRG